MKINIWVAAAVLIVVVAIEEARLGGLRDKLASEVPQNHATIAADPEVDEEIAGGGVDSGLQPPKRERPEQTTADPEPAEATDDMGARLRKMSENPVSRSMMAQGVKAMAGLWYADLAEQFGLTQEQTDYFVDLKANMLADQQQLAMKLMGAVDEEERKSILAEMEAQKKENEEAIKTFLNHDEDFAAYQEYEKRLPEHQQLDGLRGAMNGAGFPLQPEQEQALVDAMYDARTSYKGTDWNGAEGMEALADANLKERFEKDWDGQSKLIDARVGEVLDEDQLEAFRTYREQMKEMQLMGLEMAGKMFQQQKK